MRPLDLTRAFRDEAANLQTLDPAQASIHRFAGACMAFLLQSGFKPRYNPKVQTRSMGAPLWTASRLYSRKGTWTKPDPPQRHRADVLWLVRNQKLRPISGPQRRAMPCTSAN